MMTPRLTAASGLATNPPMEGLERRGRWGARRANVRQVVLLAGLAMIGMGVGLAGCVSVNAPDKPIVIELNINIKQEVIYRLAEDAGNTIEENPDIF